MLIERKFERAPPPEDNDDGDGGTEADLGTQVFKGLAGAAKFAAKWGKKIAKNVVRSGGVIVAMMCAVLGDGAWVGGG